jgi:hypothetical protein
MAYFKLWSLLSPQYMPYELHSHFCVIFTNVLNLKRWRMTLIIVGDISPFFIGDTDNFRKLLESHDVAETDKHGTFIAFLFINKDQCNITEISRPFNLVHKELDFRNFTLHKYY